MAPTTAPAPIVLGTRVRINDPSWHRHGETGTVIKVNRKTIRVQMDSSPVDVCVGSPVYYVAL